MKTTTYLVGMLITILVGTYFYITLCSECGIKTEPTPVEEKVIAPPPSKATSYPFAFSNGDYTYDTNDNYNFNVSSSSILPPLSQKVTDGVSSLKGFLTENKGKVMAITGFYKSDEKNNSPFPNLGLARANAVKNDMVANGISSTQINTIGKQIDDLTSKEGVYLGPIEYSINDQSSDIEDDLNALYDRINADPLVFYFNTNQAAIRLSAEQQQKVADISRYLDKVPTATCQVVGHTDSVGGRATNIRLGKERADFAKSYLIKSGLPEARVITSSKGPDVPRESNATREGQAKNRRTEITLNK